MSIPCSVIRDLLPLYAEDLAGEESKALVEKHLEACADCKAALEDLQEPRPVAVAEEAVPLHLMKQLMRKHTAFWCLLAACLVAAVVFALIGRMTTTQSAPYVKGVFSFGRNEDGCLFAAVTNKAPDGVDYQVEYFHDEYGRECMAIAGYTSPLLRALCVNRSGTTLKARSDAIRYVYYCDHSRSGKLTLLSGPADYAASGGGAILPRLVLNYYLFASLALAVLFFLLALILRKKASGRTLLHTALAFSCYALAHLAVKGLNGITYFLQQDLVFILLTALTLFGAVFSALSLYRLQK